MKQYTNEWFNDKWKDYLSEGHYGCDIYYPECIEWLDKVFETLTLVKDFSFQQIKWKFGNSRFYAENCCVDTKLIEEKLNSIVDNSKTITH